MARDFQAIPPSGDPLARKDYLGVRRGRRYRLPRVRARVPDRGAPLGRLAALRYKVSFDIVAGGTTRVTHKGWITELWERRTGRWQIVWEQATAIPNNFDLFLQSIEPPGQLVRRAGSHGSLTRLQASERREHEESDSSGAAVAAAACILTTAAAEARTLPIACIGRRIAD